MRTAASTETAIASTIRAVHRRQGRRVSPLGTAHRLRESIREAISRRASDPNGLWSFDLSVCLVACGGIEIAYKDGRFSVCGELGVGIGSSAEFDPRADVDPTGVFAKAKAEASFGPWAFGVDAVFCGDGSKKVMPYKSTWPFTWDGEGRPIIDVDLNPKTGLKGEKLLENPFHMRPGGELKASLNLCGAM